MNTALACTLGSFLLVACSAPKPAPVVEAPVGSLVTLHACGGLYMGGQPSEADLQALAARGVQRVINLRKPSEFKDFDERARAESLGLEYVELQFSTPGELTDDVIARARELLRQPSGQATLLHCGAGGRVAALWLAHRTLDEGVAWEQALAEAQAVGLKSPEYTERIRAYVESARR